MVNILEIKRPIIIWGTGLFGVKCMYDMLKRDLHIKYFLNNDCKIESFCNIPVYEPNQENIKNVFIIVATKISTYSIVSEQLTSMGLEEFNDYVFYPWINKKVVLLHGNCHLDVIEEYLSSSEEFCKLYSIYPNPRICNNSQNKIGDNILANCDVWIHEDIKENNPFGYFLSDEFISTKMKKDIINITIPNLFGLGKAFFPQSEYNKKNMPIFNSKDLNGMFPHADTVIDRYISEGKNLEEIYSFVESDKVLEKTYIENNFTIYMNKIKEREKNWNIKIYDFILKHYKDEKLFYDIGHPTNVILKKISLDILRILNIDDEKINAHTQLNAHENPIYPAVKRCLGMNWKEKEIRKGICGKKVEDKMDFREYVREYIWWCYTLRNEKND